jgi:hypothetical protein
VPTKAELKEDMILVKEEAKAKAKEKEEEEEEQKQYCPVF